jgi:hypothetical protein
VLLALAASHETVDVFQLVGLMLATLVPALLLVGPLLVLPQAAAPMAASPTAIHSRGGSLPPQSRRPLPPRSDGSTDMTPSFLAAPGI